MASRLGKAPFVGRAHELTVLTGYLDAAAAGAGGVALVCGEPGIGKTRLLAELAARARATGATVLTGRAYDTEGMPPYVPFVEALRAQVRTASPERLRVHLGRGASDLALLIPELRELVPDLPPGPPLDSEHQRYRLFESVTDYLLAVAGSVLGERDSGAIADAATDSDSFTPAGGRGLLLVLDDLHWADRSSLLLLLHLARRLAGTRLLVVGAYRTTDLDRAHPLTEVLAGLRRERLAERLPLASLSRDQAGALIAGLCGAPAAPAVVDAIAHETAGNAFFVEELVRHLITEGHDLADPRSAAGGWGIPDGVREVIGRRLSRLSATANQILQIGAILGDGFTFDLLQGTSVMDSTPLEDALDEALNAGMLREDGERYAFGHALIRQTVLDDLRLPRRQRLHLQAATAIEALYGRNLDPHLSELASHYRLAGAAADPDKVIDTCRRAGEAAVATVAWEEAATHFETTLGLLPSHQPIERLELLLALGAAQMKAGDRPRGKETLQRAAAVARRLPSPEHLARVALTLGGAEIEPSITDTLLVDLLREARDALIDTENEGVLHARVLARLALELRLDEMRAGSTALAEEAVVAARQASDLPALVVALGALSNTLMGPQHTDIHEQRAVADTMMQLARETGDANLTVQSHIHLIYSHTKSGDVAALDAELAACARLASELRQPYYQWLTALYQAMRALLAGDLVEAERLIFHARAVGQSMESQAVERAFAMQILALRREQGRLGECETEFSRFDAVHYLPSWRFTQWRFAAILFLHELGRVDEARRRFESLIALGYPVVEGQGGWLGVLASRAEVCAALNQVEHAAELYDIMLPHADRVPWPDPVCCVCLGSVARYLGILATTLGRWDAAHEHFEQAIAVHERMGARPLLAHTLRDHAAMLLARHGRGDLHLARQQLARALHLYTELGMTHHAARVHALLVDPSLAVAPPASAIRDGLTPREVEVLGLLAAGLSNREIAAALVVSVRTVGRHVDNIYGKIGVHERGKARQYAHAHGLIASVPAVVV